jgi:hypothetical protein
LKFPAQSRKHCGSSDGINFHVAIAQIFCVTSDAQLASHAASKVAKPHTLHPAANAIALGLARFLAFMYGNFRHCKRVILSELEAHTSLKNLRVSSLDGFGRRTIAPSSLQM